MRAEKPFSILYAEDHLNFATGFAWMIDRFHPEWAVDIVADGEKAWEYLKKSDKPVEVVVTDFNMPYMTGLELARQIVTLPKPMPVILVSGYLSGHLQDVGGNDSREWLRDNGIYAALRKSNTGAILEQLEHISSQKN